MKERKKERNKQTKKERKEEPTHLPLPSTPPIPDEMKFSQDFDRIESGTFNGRNKEGELVSVHTFGLPGSGAELIYHQYVDLSEY